MPVQSEPLTPFILNVSLSTTEASQALPVTTKHWSMQCRDSVAVEFAFETGKVEGPTAPYATLKASQSYTGPDKGSFGRDIDQDAAVTIYAAVSSGTATLEIVGWKAAT